MVTRVKRKKDKKGGKSLKKQLSLQETIGSLIRTAEDDLTMVREQWGRYHHDGVKKGFKNARKGILVVKKAAAEIRKTMAEIEL